MRLLQLIPLLPHAVTSPDPPPKSDHHEWKEYISMDRGPVRPSFQRWRFPSFSTWLLDHQARGDQKAHISRKSKNIRTVDVKMQKPDLLWKDCNNLSFLLILGNHLIYSNQQIHICTAFSIVSRLTHLTGGPFGSVRITSKCSTPSRYVVTLILKVR